MGKIIVSKWRHKEACVVSCIALCGALFYSSTAISQDNEEAAAVDDESSFEEVVEQITVTGSRIKRDAFSSTSPIQVLDASESIKLGVTSVAEMLRRSTVSSGQQIDGSINTATGSGSATFPSGGIGSANINLRGLGPERTLIMVNGKRFGLAGVRGAPVQPDLSLIPIGMVETIDVLTGGQSTIYGADAVAGVVNMRLKRDFEGLQIDSSVNIPERGGAEQLRTSLITGASWRNGNITVGVEYFKREKLMAGQRNFSDCIKRIEVAEDGEKFSGCNANPDNIVTLRGGILPQLPPGAPLPASPTGTISGADATRPRYIPGLSQANSDIGIANWGTGFNLPQTTGNQLPIPGPGAPFAIFRGFWAEFWNTQDERRAADMVQGEERFSFVANGHLDLNFGKRNSLYFETYYFNRQNNVTETNAQFSFEIPSGIAQEDANGNIIVDAANNPILVDNPLSPFPFAPALGAATSAELIVTLDDVPNTFDVEVEQFRSVIGMEGDLSIGWFDSNNWTYDVFFSYDRGTGFQSTPALFEPNLILATQTVRLDSGGNLTCGVPLPSNASGFLSPNPCVPLNAFATSIFEDGEGRFSSDAEREFLVAERINRTVSEQFNGGLTFTGDLFDVPKGGTVGVAVGGEWRVDRIDSFNDFLGIKGLVGAANPSQEGNTKGERWIYDFFAEVTAPLLSERKFVNLFQIDAAVRYTEEENFGSKTTSRIGGLYRPVSYLTFSASRNTSFRAPNLREQFLADQRGTISQGADPCTNTNFTNLPPGPAKDILAQNCALSGADTEFVGIRGISSIQVQLGGSDNLNPETSDSLTISAQFDQPWFDNFDFSFALTYWDIDIENTVRELDPATIINRCFFDSPGLTSPFCSLVDRDDTSDPADDLIIFVDASFVNIGQENASGIDINTRLAFETGVFMGQPVTVNFSAAATFLDKQTRKIFPDSAKIDNAGRIGNPDWVANTTLSLLWKRYQFLWHTRYIDGTEFDDDVVDPSGSSPFVTSRNFATSKLVHVDSVAESRFYNDLSLSADYGAFFVTLGVNNLTDKNPPLIDSGAGPNRNNAVTSSGFDLAGRTFFLNASFGY